MHEALHLILKALGTAPIGQLEPALRIRAQQLFESNPSEEDTIMFFTEIYNECDCVRSPFIKTLVNPLYTCQYRTGLISLNLHLIQHTLLCPI